MGTALRVIVFDAKLQAELGSGSPAPDIVVRMEVPEEGFGETFYPVLLELGVVAIPGSVAASLIAAWLFEAWRRRGSPSDTAIGLEASGKVEALSLDDADVERIAAKLLELLRDEETDDQS